MSSLVAARPVLVADDDPEIRGLLVAVLEDEMGLHVVEARDGHEALERAREQHPSLVLLDIQMPRVDGLEVCRRMRADPALRATPIIAVSAAERRPPALEAGCDDFLAKPFDIDTLADLVRANIN